MSTTLEKNQKRNKLEATLYMATKMMQERADEKPGKGVVFNKKTDEELRLTYDEMVEVLDDLWGYFQVYDRFKKTYCGNCVDFKANDKVYKGVGCLGTCKQQRQDITVHRFSGCDVGRKRKR